MDQTNHPWISSVPSDIEADHVSDTEHLSDLREGTDDCTTGTLP